MVLQNPPMKTEGKCKRRHSQIADTSLERMHIFRENNTLILSYVVFEVVEWRWVFIVIGFLFFTTVQTLYIQVLFKHPLQNREEACLFDF